MMTGSGASSLWCKVLLDPGDDHFGLAEVHRRVAGIVGQGHEDLAAAKPPLSGIVLDDGTEYILPPLNPIESD